VCIWLLLRFALEGIEIACRLPFEVFTTLAWFDSSIEKDILIWEMENSKEEDRFFIC
jgi:hypothetical protein